MSPRVSSTSDVTEKRFRILTLTNQERLGVLLHDLLGVVGPESIRSVLAAVLEQDLLSTWVLCRAIGQSSK